MTDDEAQIHELLTRWMDATRRGDVDTVLGLVTDDVVFLVPGRPPMHKAQFEAGLRAQAGASAPRFDGSAEIEELQLAGDWAFARTRLQVTGTPPDGSPPFVRHGYALTVYRKQDGQWRLARDANLLGPPQPRPPG